MSNNTGTGGSVSHFSLGYWTRQPGQHGMDLNESLDITEEAFDRYLKAITTYRAVTERNTYQLLERHRHRLEATVAAFANLERLGGSRREVDKRAMNITIMGEIADWLGAGRLYLESTRDFMLRQFGDGVQLERYKRATNIAFDTFAGYRFTYNLRDYTQHCGPPLGGTIAARDANDGTRTFDLYLSRSELLLAHFDWSSHAKALLSGWPEQILVMPLVEEATSGYRSIEDEVLRILLEECRATIPTMREAIERVRPAEGKHAAVIEHTEQDNEELALAFQSFPAPSDLDRLEEALATPDPLTALRPASRERATTRDPAIRHADAQAAAIVGTWIEHGGGPELNEAIRRVVEEDGDPGPLVFGLINLCAYYGAIIGQLLGSTPQALLGSYTEAAEDRGDDANP